MAGGAESYVAQYLAHQRGERPKAARTRWRRMAALTAAFTPMAAVGALPLTALATVVADVVADLTAPIAGVAVLGAVLIAAGFVLARTAAAFGGVSDEPGFRRHLPAIATLAVVGFGITEIVSGSRAPDPVIGLWFSSLVWIFVFMPMASGTWNRRRRVLWTVGPVVTAATIVIVWTAGFFALRFSRAVEPLDAYVARLAAGERFVEGTNVAGFEVERYIEGALGCDAELRINGWHERDQRWIVRCPGGIDDPAARHLEDEWYEIDRNPFG